MNLFTIFNRIFDAVSNKQEPIVAEKSEKIEDKTDFRRNLGENMLNQTENILDIHQEKVQKIRSNFFSGVSLWRAQLATISFALAGVGGVFTGEIIDKGTKSLPSIGIVILLILGLYLTLTFITNLERNIDPDIRPFLDLQRPLLNKRHRSFTLMVSPTEQNHLNYLETEIQYVSVMAVHQQQIAKQASEARVTVANEILIGLFYIGVYFLACPLITVRFLSELTTSGKLVVIGNLSFIILPLIYLIISAIFSVRRTRATRTLVKQYYDDEVRNAEWYLNYAQTTYNSALANIFTRLPEEK